MCDYSLQNVKSRPAKVGEKLRTQHFNTGTIGFEYRHNWICCARRYQDGGLRSSGNRACLCNPVRVGCFGWTARIVNYTTAIFRQIDKDKPRRHHDALEFPDGQTVLLNHLCEGQEATVLQLPAEPVTPVEIKAQERVPHI
jgi:hypothetical protein